MWLGCRTYNIPYMMHIQNKKNAVQALKYPSAHAVTLYHDIHDICQVSRQLIENKNDLLKLIKPKWPPQTRRKLKFQSGHLHTHG